MPETKRARVARWLREQRNAYASLSLVPRRLGVLALVFLLGLSVLFFRLFFLQVSAADTLADTASEFRTQKYVLHGKRGDILDSSGSVMATSIERYNVGVNQYRVAEYVRYGKDENGEDTNVVLGTGAAGAAAELAPILEMDRAELGGLLMGEGEKSTFVYIKKDISPETWRKVNALAIPGIEPEQYMKRVYPNGRVAGNILGFVGLSGDGKDETPKGQMGVEASQDDVLRGKDGEAIVETVAGAVLPNGRNETKPAVDGGSVKLTIDRDLENSLMTAIDEAVARHSAQWGAAVVIEVGTGRVLALVDSDSPDPSNLQDTPTEDWGSRAVQAPVEPGSTGKLVTFSAVLEEGTVDPYTMFTVPYEITMPNGETVHDSEDHATEQMTVAGILAKSFNTGLIQIGDTISDDVRFSYLKKFGIGEKTGIELPAESAGLLTEPKKWDRRSHYTTMFGQGWAATTLQLGQIAATIANDGVRVPLHVVESVTDANGTEVPTAIGDAERVISSETATTMLQMMQGVTLKESTAPAAAIDGYNVAGKTGTAQVPDENGQLTKRVSTFVGILPADDPQIAIAVAVYGAAGTAYGGQVAAPVFKDVGTFAVRQLGIPPSSQPLYKYPWTASQLRAEGKNSQ